MDASTRAVYFTNNLTFIYSMTMLRILMDAYSLQFN